MNSTSTDTSTFQTSPVKALIPETSPGKQGSVDLVANESDEEFSLIPKLHSTKVTPARSTEQRSLQALSGHHDLLSKQSKCPETSVPVSHQIICEQAADVDYSTNHDEDLKQDQSSSRNTLRIHTGLQDPTRSSRSTSKIKTVAKKPMSGSSKEGKQKFTSIKSVLSKFSSCTSVVTCQGTLLFLCCQLSCQIFIQQYECHVYIVMMCNCSSTALHSASLKFTL